MSGAPSIVMSFFICLHTRAYLVRNTASLPCSCFCIVTQRSWPEGGALGDDTKSAATGYIMTHYGELW